MVAGPSVIKISGFLVYWKTFRLSTIQDAFGRVSFIGITLPPSRTGERHVHLCILSHSPRSRTGFPYPVSVTYSIPHRFLSRHAEEIPSIFIFLVVLLHITCDWIFSALCFFLLACCAHVFSTLAQKVLTYIFLQSYFSSGVSMLSMASLQVLSIYNFWATFSYYSALNGYHFLGQWRSFTAGLSLSDCSWTKHCLFSARSSWDWWF